MTGWPQTIPYDLRAALEASGSDAWEAPVRAWAKSHRLKLKLQWFPDLSRRMRELDGWRWKPSVQDRWGAIREWLELNGLDAPEGLPADPELPGGDLGHSTPARRQF